MSDEMKYIRDGLDKIRDTQLTMAQTLTRNTVTLEEHVRRTAILEGKIIPIERHVQEVKGAMKWLRWALYVLMGVFTLISAIYGFIKIII